MNYTLVLLGLYLGLVDMDSVDGNISDMKKKIPKVLKVEEPAAPYHVSPISAKSAEIRRMDDAAFKKASRKVFKAHSELFRKLAQ